MRSWKIQTSGKCCTFVYLIIYCFYISTKLSSHPVLPVIPIHSSFSVSPQKRAELPCMSTSHCISGCRATRHFLLDWMRQYGRRKGSSKQSKRQLLLLLLVVPQEDQIANCNIQAKSLGQYQAGSFVLGSVSVSL